MPSLKDSLMRPDPVRYRPVNPQPIRAAGATVSPVPPVLPPHLRRNTVMLSSLPSISTDVDGITRQFYNEKNLPTRRLILPS